MACRRIKGTWVNSHVDGVKIRYCRGHRKRMTPKLSKFVTSGTAILAHRYFGDKWIKNVNSASGNGIIYYSITEIEAEV